MRFRLTAIKYCHKNHKPSLDIVVRVYSPELFEKVELKQCTLDVDGGWDRHSFYLVMYSSVERVLRYLHSTIPMGAKGFSPSLVVIVPAIEDVMSVLRHRSHPFLFPQARKRTPTSNKIIPSKSAII